jgi:poly-beta-1,6-N-acetyl-D-glucosamine synthase
VTWVFWGSAALIAYTYAGYLGWLWLRSRFQVRKVTKGLYHPDISVVMVVRNEEKVVETKLRNLLELNYPPAKKQIVVVSDGSGDGTNEILKRFGDSGITAAYMDESQGKAAGLNRAIGLSTGEIVIFTDVRQMVEADAVVALLENFADPAVGCVSGELMLGDPKGGEASQGMGLYWRIEKRIRDLESATGSVVGATGALYGVRRTLLPPLPAGLILDDVYIPMQIARQGLRVLFEPNARAWDSPDLGQDREFKRKVRTLTGNYQLVQFAPWLLGSGNPIRFEFVSHKLLRLVVPFALVTLLLSSALLAGVIYRIALGLQLCFYGLSGLAMARVKAGPVGRIADAALTFVLLNSAAAVAFANFVSGRKVVWVR